MATDTVPAAVPGPSDSNPPAEPGTQGARGFLASMVAPVEPARPTFSLNPTAAGAGPESGPDDALDRSAPGVSSASFRDTTEQATKGNDPAGARQKRSVWKELWLAAATRWAKGGGAANKRLELEKARVQARAHQVKENKTTTEMKSGGLPLRNTGGSGLGSKGNSGKSGGDSSRKGPANSNGSHAGGSGRGGSGGGRGPGGSGGHGPGSGRGGGKQPSRDAGGTGVKGPRGAGGPGAGSGGAGKTPTNGGKDNAGRGPADKNSKNPPKTAPKSSGAPGGAAGTGKPGAPGKTGKDGGPGKPGSGPGTKGSTKADLTKTPKNSKSAAPPAAAEKTPLQKSRETGHQDGSKARRVVDHVKAYADGTRDGWDDEKNKNAKEHGRLDKARDDRKPVKPGTDHDGKDRGDKDPAKAEPLTATTGGRTVTITDDKAPMEDPFMAKPTPIEAKGIDAHTITLGDSFLKPTIKRSELRTFKQYEGRLESRIDGLAKVADATKALAVQARDQATECQKLAEQAKGVEGGEKLVGTLNKLADQAKAQADEADEVHAKAVKGHDFAKAVLSNIQTRYQPLYQAVVDSDEVKPAELKFYEDRGITPSHTALAA